MTLSMTHNWVYCQVGFHMQGICFGIIMNYSMSKAKRKNSQLEAKKCFQQKSDVANVSRCVKYKKLQGNLGQ